MFPSTVFESLLAKSLHCQRS